MHIRKLYFALILGVLSVAAPAAWGSIFTPSSADFVKKASIANKFEIESSKLAAQKTQNGNIRSFAQHMIDDHTKTGEQLKDTLKRSNSQLSPEENLDDKHQKLMDKLSALSGKDFDKKYVSIQTDAHKDAVSLFKSYASAGDNAALKDFAANTLPTLKEHLKHVKQLKASE